jgi:hypothetical protein
MWPSVGGPSRISHFARLPSLRITCFIPCATHARSPADSLEKPGT